MKSLHEADLVKNRRGERVPATQAEEDRASERESTVLCENPLIFEEKLAFIAETFLKKACQSFSVAHR